jgi:demethylmenaquinone methyltransferase/2-methoxy-6-polyprenyl-1,4-benzoquinol methylase
MRLWWRLVRFGFRLLYNELAFTYDMVSWIVSLGAWRCWQRSALRHLNSGPGSRVLDLAHGTGNFHLDLMRAGYVAVGVDLSPYMGQLAQRKLRRSGLPVRLSRSRADVLPFRSASFSAVISTFPTDFILEAQTLHEIHRVLEPKGTLIIVPGAVFTGGGPLVKGLEWLYRITGQREQPSFDMCAYLDRFGFQAEMQQESCSGSAATVVIARKKSG